MAPRSRSGNNSSRARGAGDAAIHAATRALDKETDYRRSVNRLQATAKLLADRLCDGSDIECVLRDENGKEANDFLLSTRSRLKKFAEGNANRMYEIDYFIEAINSVRSEVERRQNESEVNACIESIATTTAPDYEHSIHVSIEQIRERSEHDDTRVPIEYHEMALEMRTRLGEKVSQKRPRASRGDDDDDEDLEVVNKRIDDVHSLKCPITGMLFEDPVKNKFCHHTYSRSGLKQLVKNRKKTCPVPGCANNHISLDQVEDDEEMKMKIRRFKAREEATRRKRELEQEEEEEETNQDNGFTVLE